MFYVHVFLRNVRFGFHPYNVAPFLLLSPKVVGMWGWGGGYYSKETECMKIQPVSILYSIPSFNFILFRQKRSNILCDTLDYRNGIRYILPT